MHTEVQLQKGLKIVEERHQEGPACSYNHYHLKA